MEGEEGIQRINKRMDLQYFQGRQLTGMHLLEGSDSLRAIGKSNNGSRSGSKLKNCKTSDCHITLHANIFWYVSIDVYPWIETFSNVCQWRVRYRASTYAVLYLGSTYPLRFGLWKVEKEVSASIVFWIVLHVLCTITKVITRNRHLSISL